MSMAVKRKQAQICAKGCEEDNITCFFCILCKYKLYTVYNLPKLRNSCTQSHVISKFYKISFIHRLIMTKVKKG